MNKKTPGEISSYVKEHFSEGCFMEVKTTKIADGQTVFKVDIDEDDVIHHLIFNEHGKLLEHKADPDHEEDFYEGEFYGRDD